MFLAAAYMFRSDSAVCHSLVFLAATPVLVACLAFIGFAVFRPEKLQSEDYQLRQHAMEILEQKGRRISIPITSLEAIVNPAKQIRETRSDEEE